MSVENRLLSATDPGLYEYPLLFMHGRRAFRFSPADRQALTSYFQRGGVLFADAICASPEFTRSFRREVESLFPGQNLARIPPEHALFTRASRGFDLQNVTLRSPQLRTAGDPLKANVTRTTPMLEGIEVDGRFAVIFSPYDVSCALENGASLQCQGYVKEDAARLAANVILHVLQQ